MSMHTVAVMGLGVRGKIHLHGLLENPDYYKVVGLCDIDEPKMKAVAEEYHLDDVPLFTDAEEMLKETRPEIFVFVTYPDLRLSVIQLAVKYGVKGISFEKPMAESLQEAKKIVKLCHDNGIKAVVCHQQKYLSQMQTLKKRIEDGEIGEITKIHVECQAIFSGRMADIVQNGYVDMYTVRFVWMITIRHQITCLVLWNWKMEYMLM